MTATSTHADQKRQVFARSSNAALIGGLRIIDALCETEPTAEHRLVRAWTIEELERRFPAAAAAVERAFLEDEERMIAGEAPAELDYVAILLGAIERAA